MVTTVEWRHDATTEPWLRVALLSWLFAGIFPLVAREGRGYRSPSAVVRISPASRS